MIWCFIPLCFRAPGIPVQKTNFHFNNLYITSHCRFSSYGIGMFTGLMYYKLRNSSVTLSGVSSNLLRSLLLLCLLYLYMDNFQYKSYILTALGLSLMALSMCCGLPFYSSSYEYNSVEAAAYAGLHRPSWALGSAILLLNASYGQFGKFNDPTRITFYLIDILTPTAIIIFIIIIINMIIITNTIINYLETWYRCWWLRNICFRNFVWGTKKFSSSGESRVGDKVMSVVFIRRAHFKVIEWQ